MSTRARWWGPVLVFVLAAGLLGGCGDDDGGGSAEADATTTTAVTGPGDPATPAATFRAELAGYLNEHPYLVGLVAVGASDDAASVLDQNTQDIADKIATAFGTTVGAEFAELWGAHAEQLAAGGNPTGFPAEMEELLAEHLGEEGAAEVATELEAHVETATEAVAALTGGTGGGVALRQAADAMTGLGTTLSQILAVDLGLEGEVDVPAVDLRVTLTNLLTEHVYLVGLAATDAPGAADVAAAVDANTQALAAVVGDVYGEAAGTEFAAVWGAHADLLVGYAAGQVTPEQVEAGLDEFRSETGELLEEVTEDALTAEAVAEELVPHADTVVPALDELRAGTEGVAALRRAVEVMPSTAETFSTAFVSALE